MNIVARLIKLANELDEEGLGDAADTIDEVAEDVSEKKHDDSQLENWTPHPVTLILGNNKQIILRPKTSTPPRVVQKKEESIPGPYGMPIILRNIIGGNIEGLPDERPGIFLIVSSMVASTATNRNDLLVPNDFIRDESGNVIGCKGFAKYI